MKHFIKYKSGANTWSYWQLINTEKCNVISTECKNTCNNRYLTVRNIKLNYNERRCGIIGTWRKATHLEVLQQLL